MSNFFGAIFKRAGSLVSDPIRMTKDTIKNPKKGLKEWSKLYTMNEHKDQDLFKGLGIRGWAGKHPQESALAVVGTIFGGWAAWGAYGASAAGGAMGAAGSAGGAGSGIAAGTTIGQTVAATPGMIGAAAQGGTVASTGATIGVGGSAAANTAAVTPFVSNAVVAGSGYGVGGSYATTLGGEVSVANTGGAAGSSWQSWVQNGNRAYNMMKNKGQQSGQQQQQRLPEAQIDNAHFNLQHIGAGSNTTGSAIPNSTSDIINNSGNNQSFTAQSFGANY